MNPIILFSVFSGVALLNSWFYTFLIYRNAPRNRANKLLIVLFLLISIRILECLIAVNSLTHHLFLLSASLASMSLLGPVGYAFLLTIIKNKTLHWMHYVSGLVILVASLIVVDHTYLEILNAVILLQMCIYFIISLPKIKQTEGETRKWITQFVILGGIIWLSFAVELLFPNLYAYAFWNFIVAMTLYYMTFQFKNFTHFKAEANVSSTFKDFGRMILDIMKSEKPYLDSEFSKEVLAEKIGVKPYLVSQIVNQVYQKSFSEFIAGYRINHAKGLLIDEDQQKYTIEYIAYSSGFSSLSNFYKTFKDMENLTPAEFKKSKAEMKVA